MMVPANHNPDPTIPVIDLTNVDELALLPQPSSTSSSLVVGAAVTLTNLLDAAKNAGFSRFVDQLGHVACGKFVMWGVGLVILAARAHPSFHPT